MKYMFYFENGYFEIKGMPFTQKELDELANKVFTQLKSNENTSE